MSAIHVFTPQERELAERAGRRRRAEARGLGRTDHVRRVEESAKTERRDLLGASGEIAVASEFGYSLGAIERMVLREGPDDGYDVVVPSGPEQDQTVDVKARKLEGWDLLVPKSQAIDADILVLAWAWGRGWGRPEKCGSAVELAGWIPVDEWQRERLDSEVVIPQLPVPSWVLFAKNLHPWETILG